MFAKFDLVAVAKILMRVHEKCIRKSMPETDEIRRTVRYRGSNPTSSLPHCKLTPIKNNSQAVFFFLVKSTNIT
jgi:hypothetical protein